ncbi:MAG: hypothetical protein JO250_21845 [Armatimonadetes bacterium]|nr:hypothetical protein [Armatimonadota bacterium]
MAMTLSDGFNQRKKLGADLQSWIARLGQAGLDRRAYRTKSIEGEDAFVPEPGSEKVTTRHYTIAECQAHIDALLRADRDLALRISLTNQRARAQVVDLDNVLREYTVPELLVLKNEVIPKLEEIARATPVRAEGVNVITEGEGAVVHRAIKKIERKKETLTEKGLKVEEVITEGYDVLDTTDYGLPRRQVWNEIDRIQEFAERVKQAISEANKTELVELPPAF